MANEIYDGLVATVGKLNVSPNAFSVIPGRVDLTLQIRDLSVENMEGFVENVSNMFELDYKVELFFKPPICDEGIKDIIKSVSQDLDLKHIEMPQEHHMMSELHILSHGNDLCPFHWWC